MYFNYSVQNKKVKLEDYPEQLDVNQNTHILQLVDKVYQQQVYISKLKDMIQILKNKINDRINLENKLKIINKLNLLNY